ncbi:MAG: hypothetical protein O2904_04495, partial [bacterium]|nr:hypothetical protein [bacterium]
MNPSPQLAYCTGEGGGANGVEGGENGVGGANGLDGAVIGADGLFGTGFATGAGNGAGVVPIDEDSEDSESDDEELPALLEDFGRGGVGGVMNITGGGATGPALEELPIGNGGGGGVGTPKLDEELDGNGGGGGGGVGTPKLDEELDGNGGG